LLNTFYPEDEFYQTLWPQATIGQVSFRDRVVAITGPLCGPQLLVTFSHSPKYKYGLFSLSMLPAFNTSSLSSLFHNGVLKNWGKDLGA
jgi:hypothetical protein